MKPLSLCLAGLLSAAGAEPPPLVVENGRLTANVRNAPVRAFLEEVASRAKVAVFAAEQIGDDLVSAEMKDVRLDEALRIALPGYDTFFYYGAADGAPLSMRAVWVYPRGSGTAMRPVPPQFWAGGKELEASASDKDPQVRAQAYDVLMERPGDHSRHLVLSALRGGEADQAVRQRLLSNVMAKGVELPDSILADLARDTSEEIRLMALDALAQHGEARQAAEALSTDPSEAVRQKAAEILLEAKAAESRREAAERSPQPQP